MVSGDKRRWLLGLSRHRCSVTNASWNGSGAVQARRGVWSVWAVHLTEASNGSIGVSEHTTAYWPT
jgi:hypothetical protein